MNDNNASFAQVRDQIHFDTLLDQGLQVIDSYAGQGWTDMAEHDPGITLLQDFCYGTSDLAYRHTLPLTDLLTPDPDNQQQGEGIFPAAFGPHQALTCEPVTTDDYRRALLDLHDGNTPGLFYFRNVQLVEEAESEQYQYWYDPDPDKRQFTFKEPQSSSRATKLSLKGNYHLYLELTHGVQQTGAEAALTEFLSEHRNLCEMVRNITWMSAQDVDIAAVIELEDDYQDAARVMAEVFIRTRDFIVPPARRFTAADLALQGLSNEAIYHGPRLQHGWISELPPAIDYRQTYDLNISPLVNRLLAIDGVKSIQRLSFSQASIDWTQVIDASKYPNPWGGDPLAVLAEGNWVQLLKRGQQLSPSKGDIEDCIASARLITEQPVIMPYGRYRKPADYHPVSEKLPPCYGLQQSSPNMLQKQLHQFLLPFEQSLANACRQLALLPALLAFDRTDLTSVWGMQWPFVEDDVANDVHTAYRPQLKKCLERYGWDDPKELAIIDYLLGYFGRQRAPRTLSNNVDGFLDVQRSYLRQQADLGYQRSNIRIDQVSALQKRIAARLGIGLELFSDTPELDKLPFYLVEHRALLPALPDSAYDDFQIPDDAELYGDWLQLLIHDESAPLHVGQLLDLIIVNEDDSIQNYVIPTVMVEEVDEGVLGRININSNSQLKRNLDKIIEAFSYGMLRWQNSTVFLEDMWYPLQYTEDPSLKPNQKCIKSTSGIPYPAMLSGTDSIVIQHQITPSNQSDDSTSITATVVSRDWINGSFVVEGDQFPADVSNYRWYIQDNINDRFSFMVSLVFNRSLLSDSLAPYTTEEWIKQCIQEEMPCHISALVHWLDDASFNTFAASYKGWQNSGAPLGDRSYQLLYQLSLGRTPGVPDGVGHMRIATEEQRTAVIGEAGDQWNAEVITENELFFVPRNDGV